MRDSSSRTQGDLKFPVVAVGGSAGALEAFEELFEHLPEGLNASFVVLQHLDRSQRSLLPELIARRAKLPVERVDRRQLLRPNRIYVMGPERSLELESCMLHLRRLETIANRYHPIDHFFLSLAEHCGERAIAIVVSGAGTDGARGLQAIRAAGGTTLVQDPAQAKHPGMPRNAIDGGAADAVLPCREMGEALRRLIEDAGEGGADDWEARHARGLSDICALLLERTGHDFSSYKKSTIARRVRRRLQARHMSGLEEYARLLGRDPVEVQALLRDLLISVTRFFRDEEAFAALRAEVVPALFAQARARGVVRAWVPACATGEEAYSLAMLLRQHQRQTGCALPFQVFATDIDTRALSIARQGRYSRADVEPLSRELRARYLRTGAGWYEIVPELRESCVFSEHSLPRDPPFSRVDLISCRNLFIYWEPELQRQVVPLFHYALNPDGFLFLGPAEYVQGLPELFGVVDKKQRIFRRRNAATAARLYTFPLSSARAKPYQPQVQPAMTTNADKDLGRQIVASLLDSFAPPAVVIDPQGQVVFYSGRPGRYLDPPTGSPSRNIYDLVQEPLRPYLRVVVQRALATGAEAGQGGLAFEGDGARQRLNLIARPLRMEPGLPALVLVVFQDIGPGPDGAAPGPPAAVHAHETVVQQLEAELRQTREHLQSTLEQVRSSNEELLSMNEELQSANEELQTSKEELQSANEELETVNSELSRKIEELDQAHGDLENFFQNTQVPVLFLDRELRIQKFTPATSHIFRLIETDVGRGIADIVSRVEGADLERDAAAVLESLRPIEKELHTRDGSDTYIMRIRPYRTVSNVVSGVVVTFVDVTGLKRAQQGQRRLAAIVESSDDAIISKDLNGIVTSWNHGAEKLFGYGADEMIGQSILKVVPEDHAQDVWRILQAVRRGERIGHLDTVRVHKSGRPVNVSVTVSPIRDAEGRVIGASKIARDVTGQRAAERAQAHLAAIVDSADDAIISKDLNTIIRTWNRGAERLFGYAAEDVIGRPITLLIPEDRQGEEAEIIGRIARGERVEHFETVRLSRDGRTIPISLTISPIYDRTGRIVGASKIARDIGNRKALEEALQRGLRLRDEFISIASHELKTPLTTLQLQTHIIRRALERGDASALAPERVLRLIEQTDRQVTRLGRLVDDMLEMSRLGLGKLALEREPMSLSELAHEVVRNMEEHARGASCPLLEEIEPDVHGVWDRYRLEQVIVNLLTNACRYAPGKPVTVKVAREGATAVLEVRDQGVGIAKEDQARIFERFERAAPSALGGFGIGLYLLREIVRAHGGRVELESEPGQGAAFRVRLPRGGADG